MPGAQTNRTFEHLPDHVPELLELILELHRTRPDLQKAFPEVDSPGYLRWVNVDAYMAYEEVRRHLPPVPPPERMDVVSSGGLGGFLEGGFETWSTLHRILRAQGKGFRNAGRVLDFGCGCGMTLRYWAPHAAHVELYGCDVDAEAIRWCRSELGLGDVRVTSTSPPLPYEDDAFDLIYANSIFSHLEEQNHLRWLAELARIAAPGSLVVVTTHGPSSLEKILPDADKCANVGLRQEQAQQAKVELERSGYAFCRQEGVANPDLYGMTFLSPEYVTRRWSEHFEILDHQTLGLQSWQDVVVLRPRKQKATGGAWSKLGAKLRAWASGAGKGQDAR